ncbi:MAG: 4-hydroxythreonine-4-phosphate dehydrogenase PdxA [Pseudomonadota bacterium]
MSRAPDLPLALTLGDPLGIGPEICLKALRDAPRPRPLALVGPADAVAAARRLVPDAPNAPVISPPERSSGWDRGDVASPMRAGAVSFDALSLAVDMAMKGEVAGIVTAPIEKAHWALAGVNFPGHTEALAARSGRPVSMMLVDDALRVVLVSVHVSLRDAAAGLSVEAELAAIRRADAGARALGVPAPRVAVAGLNPHAGEGGLFGREEIDVIAPAIAAAQSEGIDVSGPWPGDTVFMNARRGRFDVVVAQYHDQGLIPIKLLGLERGVNLTLGPPFIRTSPDHGTARDIAGKGVADPSSLIEAIRLADQLWENDAPSIWSAVG